MIEFTDFANAISVVSGLMTIFGIGGFVSWNFFNKERGSLADNSISVFAFSVKTGLCFLLLWPTAALFFGLHIFVVLSLGPGSMGGDTMYWNPEYPFAYLASYTIAAMLLIPFYVLLCASLYVGSVQPFRDFGRAFWPNRADAV